MSSSPFRTLATGSSHSHALDQYSSDNSDVFMDVDHMAAMGRRLSGDPPQPQWLRQRPHFLPTDVPPPSNVDEAECLMGLAHVKRDIHFINKRLSTKRAIECKLLARMYELQAKRAEVKLEEAEMDIGRTSLAVRSSHCHVYPSPSRAVQQYGSHVPRARRRHRRDQDTLAVHLD